MPVHNDSEIYKFILSIAMGLFGLLNGTGIFILNRLKKADEELFMRMRDVEKDVAELSGEHKAYHGGKK